VKINLSKRPFLAAAVLAAAAVLVMGFFVALTVRSVVAGPDAGAPAAAPTPVGHEWSQVEGHGTDGAGWWLGTTVNQALELRVNGARALRLEPNGSSPNLIGGYSGNSATAGVVGAAIGGGGESGHTNRVTDSYGTVGGGYSNQAGDAAGGTLDRSWATVGGGLGNTASGKYATIAGGYSNEASGLYSSVGGGWLNDATGEDATVGGGVFNVANASYATVGGGSQSSATAQSATVAGGENNAASGQYATVAGGWSNVASADYATIAGGGRSDPGSAATGNRVTDNYGTVGGGGKNQAGDNAAPSTDKTYATVGGGYSNIASGQYATVGGGNYHVAGGASSTVGGGTFNGATGQYATVGGGWGNLASGDLSTVGGGSGNGVTDNYATVGGGYTNLASALYATVGGGRNNTASYQDATVGGGQGNDASATEATVGGGYVNTASGLEATVGGGAQNTASGQAATVGGGAGNEASGTASMVPGGNQNTAAGVFSFAGGYRAKANNTGCFVWADSYAADFACNSNDRFMVRANGGLEFYSKDDLSTYCKLPAGSGTWSCSSSRDLKENFTPVDGQEVLASLAEIPITTWNYKAQDGATHHMGPVAQDFYAAFGLGEGETSISTADVDGVALAAIQRLYQLSQEQAARIQALEEEKAGLQQRLDDLEARVTALEGSAAGTNDGSGGALSSIMPFGPLLLGGLAIGGLVLVQRRRAGGRS